MKRHRDERSGLAPDASTCAAEVERFHASEPQWVTAHARHWYARGQNFIVGHIEADEGEVIQRPDQADEYALLITEGQAELEVAWQGQSQCVRAGQLAFVPPGDSQVRVMRPGRFSLLATTRSRDLCERCANAPAYAEPHPQVAPLQDWPMPPSGWRVRCYDIDVPPEEGRFGRIWRCTTLMLNVVPESFWLRGPTQLSPHHHESFEQGSLVLKGDFTHHLRWPWTPDRTRWRDDGHEQCGAPSLAVISPHVIHTSEAVGAPPHLLVDVFAPPRADFSLRPGWVLNADEYPLPETLPPG